MIDQTDLKILELLSNNSRMQWQEIGEIVHLTGQAVKNRINRMEKLGIIDGYTVRLNYDKLGIEVTAYVTVYMKTTDHYSFQKYIKENKLVAEAHRISGDGCYLLKIEGSGQEELVAFLDGMLQYGNYRVSMSISKIK